MSEIPPRVTVITPSYNQARFLESTIRSVIEQDYPSIEHIVIDGDSRDGSVDIIRRYESHLAYWISESDSGQADAINKGLARATGKYVAWLNSDDIYLPGAIHRAVAALARNPNAGLVYANWVGINADGDQTNWPHCRQYSLVDLLSMRIIPQPTVFMRRDVLQSVGGIDPTYHLLMDHHLWVRIARVAPILFVDEYWAGARHHAQAKNSTQRLGFTKEARRILAEMSLYPDTAALIKQHPRQIEAGQKVFEAGYLLADERADSALHGFLSAIYMHPRCIRHCWRLTLLSLVQALHFKRAQTLLYHLRAQTQRRRYRRQVPKAIK